MSTLQEFLVTHTADNVTDEVAISPRFKDNDGTLLKFKIRALTGEEHSRFNDLCTKIDRKTKSVNFDSRRFKEMIVINGCIDPNFKDAASISRTGCVTPEQFVHKVLLAGDLDTLSNEIMSLSGFDADMDALQDEAKN